MQAAPTDAKRYSFFMKLKLAVRVPLLWDRALQHVANQEYTDALGALRKIEPVGRAGIHASIMIGHCHWAIGEHEQADRCFRDARALFTSNRKLSDADKTYLNCYISAHSEPQFTVPIEGVSPRLLRLFPFGE